ncbi:iron complex outermembrane receptor protein [Desulfobaculum xiamenense]|uniref:Iron complex outermembrane receptor protein n=1 Tax=Desulfobaculum xiamenense TaxID=995050 RepID=A0A846QDZ5_9BACT|nr:TonB-dependent receptor plug domain-containing protein [Desulfobaculum xiamenense]NJB66598.1 iron complex outermembrane receptor protein [Desulfobaculum xiamenense]
MKKHLVAGILLLAALVSSVSALAGETEKPADAVRLDEMTVVATPLIHGNEVDRYGAVSTVVSEEQIRDLNALDIASALRRTPGVTITRYNPVGAFGGGEGGAVFVRGMGSSRPGSEIKTYIDGVPVYMGLWNHPLLDLLPIDPAGSVEVIKGPQPHRFGDAFSAINIVPKTAYGKDTFTTLEAAGGSYGTVSQSIEHGGDLGGFDYYLGEGFRRSDGHRSGGDGRQASLFANLGMDLNDNWSARVFALGLDNAAGDPGPDTGGETDGTYDTGLRMAVVTLANDFGVADGELKFFVNAGEGYWKDQSGDDDENRNDFWFWGLKAHETVRPIDGLELTAGIDQQWWDGNIRNTKDDGTESSVLVPEFSLCMPYASANYLIGDEKGWHAIPSVGARFYSHNKFDDTTAPHAGIVAGYGTTEVHASIAKGVVYPGLEVTMVPPVSSAITKWDELDPEEVWHTEIGIRHTFNAYVRADFTYFHDDGENRYVFTPGRPPSAWSNTEEFDVQGIEASVTVTPTDDIALFASITTQDVDPDNMPYAPDTTVKAGVNWHFAELWTLSADCEYVDDMYALSQSRKTTVANTEKVDSHFLLNARLARAFELPSWSAKGEVFCALENITDTDYEYRPDYPMPGINGMVGARLTF